MTDPKEPVRETLEIPSQTTFPSMLLLKKRPLDLDPSARAAEVENLKKRGEEPATQCSRRPSVWLLGIMKLKLS